MYIINPSICTNCGDCMNECPMGAISRGTNGKYAIDPDGCTDCGSCTDICSQEAVRGS